ncbi:MAG: pyridine nucleotide-disulfide oxidoreductase/dicluster-binding protein, partial [Clostridiaceae bacterium]
AGYDENGARAEASRCLDCHCLVCVRECVFMQKFDRFPRLYIREIANTISLLRDGVRSGKNLMVACSLCGLCGKLCPNGIPMERVVRLGRAAMVEKGELSEAIYDFPVRDMLFSNGEEAAFCRHAPGKTKSKRVFFPGCQLAACTPETVMKTYDHLIRLEPETGILLGCCGAPADWSGRERLYEETIAALKEKLSALGGPEVICACPTCLKQLGAAGVNAVSLYPLLNGGPLPDKTRRPQLVAVHDSCAARDEADTQAAVRSLLGKCGYEVSELAMSGEKTKCCGYGGLVFYGDREVTQGMIETRAAESPLPYVSYCNVCRDYLLKGGKPGLHLLDVFFGEDAPEHWLAPGASISQKEENRLWLADEIARRFYGENRAIVRKQEFPLKISGAVRAILEDRLITERSVRAVIAAAESTKKRLKRPSDGHFIASLRPGIITYWVEYGMEDRVFIVYNAYSHRVDISEARL